MASKSCTATFVVNIDPKAMRLYDESVRLIESGAVAKPTVKLIAKLNRELIRRSYTCRKS